MVGGDDTEMKVKDEEATMTSVVIRGLYCIVCIVCITF